MKRFILLILSICLLCSCTPTKQLLPFDTFIENVTDIFLDGTTSFQLNYIYNNSVYDSKVFGLGFVDELEYNDTMEEYQLILSELKQYNQKQLNSQQQVLYTTLEDYLKRQLVLKDYYYYQNPYIGSYSSYIQELPLLLEMYTFMDEEDIHNYFKNIQAFKSDFIKACQLEEIRQEKNLGYSQVIIDDILKQVKEIIDENGENLIQSINNTFDHLDFLSQEKKEEYKKQNKYIIQHDYMDAYKALYDNLKQIKGKETNNSINDKKYYQNLIYHQIGIKDSISSIEKRLMQSYEDNYNSMVQLLMMNQELLDQDNIYDIDYKEFTDCISGLDNLKTIITKIVPEIEDLSYSIYEVPESLQDGFAPAAYLHPKIDMDNNQKETIMINPSVPQTNIFPTLVHEGYPGHLYQNSYLRLKNYPDLMYLLDCIGYSEGWAIYMENRCSEFLENHVSWQKLVQANDSLSSCILALIDIGIHYKGWDYKDCVNFYNQHLNLSLTNELLEIYNVILQIPGYYLYYMYSGELFHDFYIQCKDKLGNNFNEIEFHQTILDCGTIGLDALQKKLNAYIKAND